MLQPFAAIICKWYCSSTPGSNSHLLQLYRPTSCYFFLYSHCISPFYLLYTKHPLHHSPLPTTYRSCINRLYIYLPSLLCCTCNNKIHSSIRLYPLHISSCIPSQPIPLFVLLYIAFTLYSITSTYSNICTNHLTTHVSIVHSLHLHYSVKPGLSSFHAAISYIPTTVTSIVVAFLLIEYSSTKHGCSLLHPHCTAYHSPF
jgi:hypothetical protein